MRAGRRSSILFRLDGAREAEQIIAFASLRALLRPLGSARTSSAAAGTLALFGFLRDLGTAARTFHLPAAMRAELIRWQMVGSADAGQFHVCYYLAVRCIAEWLRDSDSRLLFHRFSASCLFRRTPASVAYILGACFSCFYDSNCMTSRVERPAIPLYARDRFVGAAADDHTAW